MTALSSIAKYEWVDPASNEIERLAQRGFVAKKADRVRPTVKGRVALDVVVSLALLIILSPILLAVCVLALFDVGSPILFWQQRVGLNGQPFLLYKIRTLRSPYDWRGRAIAEENRLSSIGVLLRKLRLDELPQLLNVIVGDMSLIGPRPLLPQDQPDDPTVRLVVRPGISGWAQVNGGTALNAQEKQKLDEWYVRNASMILDLRIVLSTFCFLFRRSRDTKPPVVDVVPIQGPQRTRSHFTPRHHSVPAE